MSNREEFEAEWVKIIGEVPKAIRFSDDEGGYIIAYDSLKNEPNTRFLVNALNVSLHMWQARVPEGYVVVPKGPSSEIIVAIESKVEDQLKASAIEADPFRLDGETIYEAMVEAVEK